MIWTMKDLSEGFRRFSSSADAALYSSPAQGQQPHTPVISCSDSRVIPELIFDAAPGEIFVLSCFGRQTKDVCVQAFFLVADLTKSYAIFANSAVPIGRQSSSISNMPLCSGKSVFFPALPTPSMNMTPGLFSMK